MRLEPMSEGKINQVVGISEEEAEHLRKITWVKVELQRLFAKDKEFLMGLGYDEKADGEGEDARALYIVLNLSEGFNKMIQENPDIVSNLYDHVYSGAPFDFEK